MTRPRRLLMLAMPDAKGIKNCGRFSEELWNYEVLESNLQNVWWTFLNKSMRRMTVAFRSIMWETAICRLFSVIFISGCGKKWCGGKFPKGLRQHSRWDLPLVGDEAEYPGGEYWVGELKKTNYWDVKAFERPFNGGLEIWWAVRTATGREGGSVRWTVCIRI